MDEELAPTERWQTTDHSTANTQTNANRCNEQHTKSVKAKPKKTESRSTMKLPESSWLRVMLKLQITALEEQKKILRKEEECQLIVYENTDRKTVQQILQEHAEELRTEPWLLAYEPSTNSSVYLSNLFDVPCITLRREGQDDVSWYISNGDINFTYMEMIRTFFDIIEFRPYSEWCALQRQQSDENKTLLEIKQFVSRCRKRRLSDECRQQIRAAVMTI